MKRDINIVILMFAFVMVFTFAGTAFAESSSEDVILLLDKDGNKVIVPGPNITDKENYNPEDYYPVEPEFSIEGCGWPDCNPATLSNSTSSSITPPGGTTDRIKNSFSSSVSYPKYETWARYSGSSSSYWLGINPVNATSVTHRDHWWVSGLSISVTYPPGVGIEGSGSSAVWEGKVNGNWRIDHYFSGIQFNGMVIYRAYESITSTFQFGTTFYTISCQDDALI